MSTRTRALLGLTITLFVCALLYWPAMHGPFLFDDFPNLAALDSIDHVSSWRDLGIYLSQPRDLPGRPLAMLSFLLQRTDWPGNPFPFKLVNLGLHLACGLLLYALVLQIARAATTAVGDVRPRSSRAHLAALLATAGWLMNPIQLSGVVLIVQRMTLLMAIFVLLGLLAYLRGLLGTQLSLRQRAAWILLGLGASTALAFLSKENGILLPVYALALDGTLLSSSVKHLPPPLQWLRRLLIWPVVAFVIGFLVWIAFLAWGQHNGRDFTVGERLLTEPRAIASYLGNIFLPRFGVYGLYHEGFTVSRALLSPPTTALCLGLLLASIGVAIGARRRWPLLALAILWYLGGQLLESSTVMLELYFEHRNYVPFMGVMMAIAIGITHIEDIRKLRLCLVATCAWLLACGFTTALSARIYASEDVLAYAWAQAEPDSVRAQVYLAERLFKQGKLDSALEVLNSAASSHPNNAGIAENRVHVLCVQQSLKDSDIRQLSTLLQTAPFDRGGYENMEPLRELAETGHCPALNPDSWLRIANILLGNPAYLGNPIATGFLHYQKHYWAVNRGDLDTTLKELDITYRVDPDANIPRMKAKYLVSAGLYDQAIAVLQNIDYSRLPLLRRLLVNDRDIDQANIEEVRKMKLAATTHH